MALRLWTVHPQYLDARGLVALWRETLLAQKVLRGETVGYTAHPQLARFRMQANPLACIASYLRAIHAESLARGYRFDSAKIGSGKVVKPIVETDGQLLYEWEHLKRKLSVRDPIRFKSWRGVKCPESHPLFVIVPGGIRDWERVME